MFFSADILTNKNSSLSIVWMMATLGAKPVGNSNNKISKSDIQNTEIPNACKMVEEPDGPMALRLSSNLLYGISLVFQHQVSYLLSDVSIMRTKVSSEGVLSTTTPTNNSTIKQLRSVITLRNDPSFNLDFGLLPLGHIPELTVSGAVELNIETETGEQSQFSQSSTQARWYTSLLAPETARGRGRLNEIGELITSNNTDLIDTSLNPLFSQPYDDDTSFGDLGFEFGVDGNILYSDDSHITNVGDAGDGKVHATRANSSSIIDSLNSAIKSPPKKNHDKESSIEHDVGAHRLLFENTHDELPVNFFDNGHDDDYVNMDVQHIQEDNNLDNLDLNLDFGLEQDDGQHTAFLRKNATIFFSASQDIGQEIVRLDPHIQRTRKRGVKRCQVDSQISIPVSELQAYRDQYVRNMRNITAKRRKLRWSSVLRRNTTTLWEFMGNAIEAPFPHLFQNLETLDLLAQTNTNLLLSNEGEGNVPRRHLSAEIEVGRLAPNTPLTPNAALIDPRDLRDTPSSGLPTIPRSGGSSGTDRNEKSSPLVKGSSMGTRHHSVLGNIPEIEDPEGFPDDSLENIRRKREAINGFTDREIYELQNNNNMPADFFNGPDYDDEEEMTKPVSGNNENLSNSSFSINQLYEGDDIRFSDLDLDIDLDESKYMGLRQGNSNMGFTSHFYDDRLFLKYTHKMIRRINRRILPPSLIGESSDSIETFMESEDDVGLQHNTQGSRAPSAGSTHLSDESRSGNRSPGFEPYPVSGSSSSVIIRHKQKKESLRRKKTKTSAHGIEHDYVAFDDLFPPETTTKEQAASAFLQVLRLVTNGKLKVKQEMPSAPGLPGPYLENENTGKKRSGIWMLV